MDKMVLHSICDIRAVQYKLKIYNEEPTYLMHFLDYSN